MWRQRDFLKLLKLVKVDKVFCLSKTLNISRKIHQRAWRERYTIPITIVTELDHIGKTSFSTVNRMYDSDSLEEYAVEKNIYVFVDGKTRRPKPIPSDWRNQYWKYSRSRKPSAAKMVKKTEGSPSFTLDVRVAFSNTDVNGHTNLKFYMRFCSDCAAEACMAGTYKHLKKNLLHYNVKKVDCLFTGESRLGDILTVQTWQDKNNPCVLYFVIFNHNKPIYHQTTELYETHLLSMM